jgi:ribosomal protein S12 methylthiotransferase accessory factor
MHDAALQPESDEIATGRAPRLKRHLHAVVVPPDAVWVFSELGHRVLESRLLALLVPLLDGRRTAEELADILDDRITASDVLHGLWQLEDAGYLAWTTGDEVPGTAAGYADMLGVDSGALEASVRAHPVQVHEFGRPGAASLLRDRLTSLGLYQGDDSSALGLVLVDSYSDPRLAAFNRESLSLARPWLIVKPVGAIVWCGPLFVPGATACWSCLARRLRERDFWASLDTGGEPPVLSTASLESTMRLGIEMAATEAWKWAVDAPGRNLRDRLVTFDTRTLTSESHVLVRQPTCPDCGRPPALRNGPLPLQSRRKLAVSDGGYRCQPPEATYERFKHHVSRITGIVDRVERLPAGDMSQVQMFSAPYAFARSSRHVPQRSARQAKLTSAGKGMTAAQARTGALCEAAERYSGIYRGDEATVRARARDLDRPWIEPNACMLFSQRQYDERDQWNSRDLKFHWVPVPFDPDRPIEWTPAWSLTEPGTKYLPTAYCYYNYPIGPNDAFCQADSNGSAAGANLEEAILQGFLELVERDAVALWWYTRAPRPRVRLDASEHPFAASLEAAYRSLKRSLAVFDITTDCEVPAFAAVATADDDPYDLLLGFGAHFDPAIALSRSLTELNQFLPGVLAGRPRQLFAEETLDTDFLTAGTPPSRRLADFAHVETPDLLDDVQRCVEIARNRGLEMLVVDLTREDVGVPVVKVIVPGLRPFWARFAPGRLYTVPPAIGWRDAPVKEEALNPAYILF